MCTRAPIERYLHHLAGLHARLCPRQVLGVRMGQYAGELLAVELPRTDRRLCCFVETDGCFADAVSVATGCRLGKRTLRLMDHGKVAATCVDVEAGRAIRIWPDPRARSHAWRYAPDAPTPWHAQLIGYQLMPVADLLCSVPVAITVSMAALLAHKCARAECVSCGEDVFERSEEDLQGRVVCAACAGRSYYTRLSAHADALTDPITCETSLGGTEVEACAERKSSGGVHGGERGGASECADSTPHQPISDRAFLGLA